MSIHDPVLGVLEPVPDHPHLLWTSKVTLPLLGRTRIRVSTIDGPIDDLQRQAWQHFLNSTERYVKKAVHAIRDCQHFVIETRTKLDFDAAIRGHPIELPGVLRQPHICVGSGYGDGVLLGLAFTDVEFEQELGVGVVFISGELLDVGDAGVAFVV